LNSIYEYGTFVSSLKPKEYKKLRYQILYAVKQISATRPGELLIVT